MPPSTIFYIAAAPHLPPQDQPFNKLAHNIQQTFRCEKLPPWTLEHRLFRETSSQNVSGSASGLSAGAGSTTNDIHTRPSSTPNIIQCLTLSWLKGRTWIGHLHASTTQTRPATQTDSSQTGSQGSSQVPSQAGSVNGDTSTVNTTTDAADIAAGSEPPTTAAAASAVSVAGSTTQPTVTHANITVSTIDTSSLEEFTSLLGQRLAPLWSARGGLLQVRDGVSLRIGGDILLRYGEVVQGMSSAGTSGSVAAAALPVVRGVVCEIMYIGGEVAADAVGDVVGAVWDQIGDGITGVTQFSEGCDRSAEEDNAARWMNVLRVRDGR